jgi:23S rRNA (uracil1939-C5)-methyltransferase
MARLKKGECIEVTVDDLAYGGHGVARHGGLVVMVAGGVPGDRLRARVTRMRRSLAEARAEEVLDPSPLRVEPFCRHNTICGGCRHQEIAYPEQVRLKARQIEEALRRIGGFAEPPLEDPIASVNQTYYRNKMEFSFGMDRETGLKLGMHPAGDFRDVFQIEACHLLSERSNEQIAWITREARETGLPVYDQIRHEGFFRFLSLREGKATGQTMAIFTTTTGDDAAREALRDLAARLRVAFPEIRSVVRQVNEGRAGVAAGEYEEVLAGERTIEEQLGGYRFEISARAFFQTNTSQAEKLYARVLEDAALSGSGVVFDLFSGTGTISILMSSKARKVYGIEANPDAVADAVRNAALNNVTTCEFVQGEVRDVLARPPVVHVRPEVVIVNPPRAGVHPALIKRLLRLEPPRIVYVSCNPTTLARDLAALAEGGYSFRRAVPVDMFPHTAHIESVALMERRS